jgi:hypothetical protein
LVQQWRYSWLPSHGKFVDFIATQAAQWGADQELDACCAEVEQMFCWGSARDLRAARRPKPPSLKEQAIDALHGIHDQGPTAEQVVIIRRALEALPND